MKASIRVLSFALLIAWMLLIFNFSAQTATESSKTSGGFSYKIAGLFVDGFENMTAEEQQAIIENMSFPIRKSAHFCIFAVLAAIAFLNISFFERMPKYLKNFTVFVFSALYAATDEYHQKFVLGRSCELRDWLVDTAGILTGILFCGLLTLLCRKLHRKRERRLTMRKKELINENRFISEELLRQKSSNDTLKAEIEQKIEQIKLLNTQIDDLKQKISQGASEGGFVAKTSDIKKDCEGKSAGDDKVSQIEDIIDYGAITIGKIIMSAAEHCGKADKQKSLKEALLNRAEQAKCEVLDIVFSDRPYIVKMRLIDSEYKMATYFFDRTVMSDGDK